MDDALDRAEKRKKKTLRYIISSLASSVVAGALTLFYFVYYNEVSRDVGAYQILCDSFFITGVLVFGIGLLMFIADNGMFDMLGYGFYKLASLFKKNPTKTKYKDFYEYREAKKDRKVEFVYLLIIGAFWIAFATLFFILYKLE